MSLSKPAVLQLLKFGYRIELNSENDIFYLGSFGKAPRPLDDLLVKELVEEGHIKQVSAKPLIYMHCDAQIPCTPVQVAQVRPKRAPRVPPPDNTPIVDWRKVHRELQDSWLQDTPTQADADHYHERLRRVGRVIPEESVA